MSAELSRMITGLQKTGASVAQSGRNHHLTVASVLTARVTPILPEGQPPPDFAALQLGVVSLVESEVGKLVTFDEAHVTELDHNRKQRNARNIAVPRLSGTLSRIQKACEGVYDELASVDLFGGVEVIPSDPLLLHKLGERVQRRLADPTYEISQEVLPGWQMSDREKLAAEVKVDVDRLGSALGELGNELHGSDYTLLRKQRAIQEVGRTIRHGATCLASLYSLAGFDELAAKVRPKRRAARKSGDDDAPEAEAAAGQEEASASPGDDATETEGPTGPTLVVS